MRDGELKMPLASCSPSENGNRALSEERPRRSLQTSDYKAMHRVAAAKVEGQFPKGIQRGLCGHRWVLHPMHPWILMWNRFVALALLVVTILAPLEIPFSTMRVGVLFWLNIVVDAIFLLDTIMQFFLAFERGRTNTLVWDMREIARNYLTGFFIIDLISVFPFEMVVSLTNGSAPRWLHLLRFLKVLRFLRWQRLSSTWRFSFVPLNHRDSTLLQCSLGVLVAAHWMGCFWICIGQFAGSPTRRTWIDTLQDKPDSDFQTDVGIYIVSVYWATFTLTGIGYGDIIPQSLIEYFTCIFCMFIGACVWATIVAQVVTILTSLNQTNVEFQKTMEDLEWMMEDRDLKHELRKELRKFFMKHQDTKREDSSTMLLEQMSPGLQKAVAFTEHAHWLKKVFWLENQVKEMSPFTVALALQLKARLHAAQEFVVHGKRGDPSRASLYVLVRGLAAREGRVLSRGDIWGADMILDDWRLRDSHTVFSITFLQCWRLDKSKLLEVMERFPNVKPQIRQAAVRLAIIRGIIRMARRQKRRSEAQRMEAEASHHSLHRQPTMARLVEGGVEGGVEEFGYCSSDEEEFQDNEAKAQDRCMLWADNLHQSNVKKRASRLERLTTMTSTPASAITRKTSVDETKKSSKTKDNSSESPQELGTQKPDRSVIGRLADSYSSNKSSHTCHSVDERSFASPATSPSNGVSETRFSRRDSRTMTTNSALQAIANNVRNDQRLDGSELIQALQLINEGLSEQISDDFARIMLRIDDLKSDMDNKLSELRLNVSRK